MEDKYRTDIEKNVAHYEQNSVEFIDSTINLDISELYKPFEEQLFPGARILDLGCGSGRDSRYFVSHGYDVVAVDPSAAMCEQTKIYARVPVYKMRADDMKFSNEFDAVWACASLLHVSKDKQKYVLCKIMNSLKDGGIIYGSWKYGYKVRKVDGRMFTDMNEEYLQYVVETISDLELLKWWITQDIRKDRYEDRWLNALLKKNVGH